MTTAVGNVGRPTYLALARQGIAARAADLDSARVRSALGHDVPAVRLDFRDRSTFEAALDGCDAIFLVRPPRLSAVETTINPFLDVALQRGVKHVFFLSVKGAEKRSYIPHRKVEVHLERSALAYTFLRCGFFAQNLGTAYREDIVRSDRLYLPAGRGKVSWLDVRDVGDLVPLLCEDLDRHRNVAYEVTGTDVLDFDGVAEVLTDVLGRPIRYVPASIPGYAWHLSRQGLAWTQIAVQTVLHANIRSGTTGEVRPVLSQLLGRAPRTLRTYVEDHRELFMPA